MCRRRELSSLSLGQVLKLRCDGCEPGLTAGITYIAREAGVHAARHLFAREPADARLSRRSARRPPTSRCACSRGRSSTSICRAHAHERHRRQKSHEALRRRDGRRSYLARRGRRRDRRLPRAERVRQDDDHPHDLRPSDARATARGPCSATTSSRESRSIKRRGRLHDAAVLVLRGPDDRGESALRRAALRSQAPPARSSTKRWPISG